MFVELTPKFENVKSYYRKALIELKENAQVLYSYDTKVAKIENGKLEVYNTQSQTTVRHIREFIQQHGFPRLTKQQINEYYI